MRKSELEKLVRRAIGPKPHISASQAKDRLQAAERNVAYYQEHYAAAIEWELKRIMFIAGFDAGYNTANRERWE